MNPDLLIKIGADLSQFDKDMNRAKEKFKQATVAINKIRKNTSLMGSIDDTLKSIEKQEKAYKKMFAEVKATALANGRKVTDAQIHGVTRAALAEKRVRDTEIKKYMATKKNLSDRAHKREMRQLESKSLEEIKNLNKIAAKKKKHDNGVNWNGHNAFKTVALYGSVMKVVYDTARAFRAVGAAVVDFDKMVYQNMGVLQLNKQQATELAIQVENLGIKYGTAFADIQDAMITLGRAGVSSKDIERYTESVLALAQITGDTLGESAEAVASYREVFRDAAKDVEFFGGKMAYIANETVLSMANFKIMGNYALSASKNMGMTYDTLMSLMGAMSKVGKQSSTIGTTVRRLGTALKDNSDKVLTAWRKMGFEQEKLAKAMHINSDETTKAITRTLAAMSKEEYRAATKELNVLMKDLFDTLRDVGTSGQFDKFSQHYVDAVKQAQQVSSSFTKNIQKLKNTFLKLGTTISIDVLDILNEFISKTGTDATNALNLAEIAFEAFGKTALIIIVAVANGLNIIVGTILTVISSLGQLAGKGASLLGSALGATNTEDIIKAKKRLLEVNEKLTTQKQGSERVSLRAERAELKRVVLAHEQGTGFANTLKKAGDMTDKAMAKVRETTVAATGEVNELSKKLLLASVNGTKLSKALSNPVGTLKKDANGKPIGDLSADTSAPAALNASVKMQELLNRALKGEDVSRAIILAKMDAGIAKQKIIANAATLAAKGKEQYEKAVLTAAKENEKLLSLQLDRKRELAKREEQAANKRSGGGNKAARDADRLSRDAIALLEAKMKLEQAIVDMNDAKNSNLYTQVQLDMKALKVAKDKLEIAEKYKAAAIAEGLPKGDRGEKKLIDLKIRVTKAQEDVNKKAVAAWNRVIKDLKEAGKSAFDQLMKLDFKGALETLTGGFLDSMLKPMKDYFSTTFAGLFKQDGAIGSMFSGMFGSGKKGGILDKIGGIGAVVSAVVGVAGSLFSNKAAKDLEKAQKRATENATANSKTIENSLKDLEDIGTLGLKHSGKMVGSLQTIADMTLISAKSMGADLSGTGYTEVTKRGFFNDSTTKLMESGISLDAATIAQINNGQMTATKYMIEVTENSGFLGIGASTDTKRTDMGSANGAIMEPITEAYRQGVEVIRSASSALGVSAEEFAATAAIWETSIQDLNFKGMDAAQRAQLIQGAIAGDMDRWAESLVSLQPILEKFAHDGEASGEALIRIVTTYELAEKAMRDMGATLEPLTEGGYEVADALIKAAGGMAKFAKGVKDFQEAFMTDGQKQAVLQRDLAISSAQIGLSLPQTAQGMLDLHNRLMQLAATSPIAAEQLRWLNANVADLAKMVEYAGSAAGSAAGKIGGCGGALGGCGSAAKSCGSSAKSCGKNLEDLSATLTDIAGITQQWVGDLAGAKLMLDATTKETGLTGLTNDNFLAKWLEASKNGITTEELAKWSKMSSAIKSYQSELDEIAKETADKAMDAAKKQLAFYDDILKKIDSAYTGSLSPLNSREKAEYLAQQAGSDLAAGDSVGYIETITNQLEYEKRISRTREEYELKFNDYIETLKNAEPEKTTDDVVDTLEVISAKIEGLQDAIEQASYQP